MTHDLTIPADLKAMLNDPAMGMIGESIALPEQIEQLKRDIAAAEDHATILSLKAIAQGEADRAWVAAQFAEKIAAHEGVQSHVKSIMAAAFGAQLAADIAIRRAYEAAGGTSKQSRRTVDMHNTPKAADIWQRANGSGSDYSHAKALADAERIEAGIVQTTVDGLVNQGTRPTTRKVVNLIKDAQRTAEERAEQQRAWEYDRSPIHRYAAAVQEIALVASSDRPIGQPNAQDARILSTNLSDAIRALATLKETYNAQD